MYVNLGHAHLSQDILILHRRYRKYIFAKGYWGSQEVYFIWKRIQPQVPGIGWQRVFAWEDRPGHQAGEQLDIYKQITENPDMVPLTQFYIGVDAGFGSSLAIVLVCNADDKSCHDTICLMRRQRYSSTPVLLQLIPKYSWTYVTARLFGNYSQKEEAKDKGSMLWYGGIAYELQHKPET